MQFKSSIEGRNADVAIHVDRVEWGKPGGRFVGGKASSSMIPIKSLSSVTTMKDGLLFHKVRLIASGSTIDIRVDKALAESVKATVTQLMLGTHPSQVADAPPPPPPAASTAAASGSVADELQKLAGLRDAGVLDESEFATQKARLLGKV